MDLVYLSELAMPINEGADGICASQVEGHMEEPFGPTVVNDQVALGDRAVMSIYMQLAKRVTQSDSGKIGGHLRMEISERAT